MDSHICTRSTSCWEKIVLPIHCEMTVYFQKNAKMPPVILDLTLHVLRSRSNATRLTQNEIEVSVTQCRLMDNHVLLVI